MWLQAAAQVTVAAASTHTMDVLGISTCPAPSDDQETAIKWANAGAALEDRGELRAVEKEGA